MQLEGEDADAAKDIVPALGPDEPLVFEFIKDEPHMFSGNFCFRRCIFRR
ncbi:MAG TPA: hypothetical protein PLX89_05335 [Verrucomicrobiota bacterium]|nr:hypothetical protein [Verrucomicrobiota bacterium]